MFMGHWESHLSHHPSKVIARQWIMISHHSTQLISSQRHQHQCHDHPVSKQLISQPDHISCYSEPEPVLQVTITNIYVQVVKSHLER